MKLNKKITSILKFLFPSIVSATIAFLLFRIIFAMAFVPSTSMENTIPQKSFVFAIRTRFVFDGFHRGDIVIFQPSDTNSQTIDENRPILVKRIVGISGDTVEIKDGVTYVNGSIYEEPWLAEIPETEDFGPYTVGDGKIFVMGDNRNDSLDSRYWIDPYVDEDAIIGKEIFVFKALE